MKFSVLSQSWLQLPWDGFLERSEFSQASIIFRLNRIELTEFFTALNAI